MANLRETPTWETGIYQLETSDPVMGGENGIDNRAPRQLANRTLWLKTELAKAVESIGRNQTLAEQQFALKTTQLSAGSGLTGGGVLRDHLTLSLGTPSKISATSTNTAAGNTHSHEIDKASTTVAGIVQLVNNLTAGGANKALTAEQGKILAESIATAVSGSFPNRGALGNRDLNDLKADENTGVWYQSANTSATTARHYPVTKAGTLLVLPAAYKGQQIYIPFDEPVVYHRNTGAQSENHAYRAWRKIGDDKLGNSGPQTFNGDLTIAPPPTPANRWPAVFFQVANGVWRMEFNPDSNNDTEGSIRFNFVFQQQGKKAVYLSLPAVSAAGEKVAYQRWVEEKIGQSFTGTLSGTGWTKLPNGLILQWGQTPLVFDDRTADITFPIAFPTACFGVQLTEDEKRTHSANASHVVAKELSRTKFTFYHNSTLAVSTSCWWFAIGN